MYNKKTVAVVIPAYNEEKLIDRVIDIMPMIVDKIVIVDDCRKDNTSLVVQRYVEEHPDRVVLIHHEVNQGVGGAIATGADQICPLPEIISGRIEFRRSRS
jgi:glycosyltransferase involved in cell wall biosynthesis